MNRFVTIASLVGGALAIILSLLYSNPIFPLIAAVFFCFSLIVWKYGYLLVPVFTKASRIVEVRGLHEIPPSRDYVLQKAPNGYYAAKYLEIRFYESWMDKKKDERGSMLESFEKAIGSLKYIVKISMLISPLDLSAHIDEIKTKRGALEAKKGRETKASADDTMRMDRELAYLNRLLDRITQGERPVELVSFASTTAFGLTREEAVARVARQAKELKTILSSSLGCDVRELNDTDMIKCFEWDFFFPTTQEEVRDETF
jgi:hypothetical protein